MVPLRPVEKRTRMFTREPGRSSQSSPFYGDPYAMDHDYEGEDRYQIAGFYRSEGRSGRYPIAGFYRNEGDGRYQLAGFYRN